MQVLHNMHNMDRCQIAGFFRILRLDGIQDLVMLTNRLDRTLFCLNGSPSCKLYIFVKI